MPSILLGTGIQWKIRKILSLFLNVSQQTRIGVQIFSSNRIFQGCDYCSVFIVLYLWGGGSKKKRDFLSCKNFVFFSIKKYSQPLQLALFRPQLLSLGIVTAEVREKFPWSFEGQLLQMCLIIHSLPSQPSSWAFIANSGRISLCCSFATCQRYWDRKFCLKIWSGSREMSTVWAERSSRCSGAPWGAVYRLGTCQILLALHSGRSDGAWGSFLPSAAPIYLSCGPYEFITSWVYYVPWLDLGRAVLGYDSGRGNSAVRKGLMMYSSV